MKKNYYVLDYSGDMEEIGHLPQVDAIIDNYDVNKENSFDKLSRSGFSQLAPDLNGFIVNEEAKLTDLLSCWRLPGNRAFFISDKLKNVFENSLLGPHRYYEVLLVQGEKRIKYNLIHIPSEHQLMLETIDFAQSGFVVTDYFGNKMQTIGVFSLNDYYEKQQQIQQEDIMKKIAFEKVVFNQHFNPETALFRLPHTLPVFISEAMKNLLIQNKITGISIKESQLAFELPALVKAPLSKAG